MAELTRRGLLAMLPAGAALGKQQEQLPQEEGVAELIEIKPTAKYILFVDPTRVDMDTFETCPALPLGIEVILPVLRPAGGKISDVVALYKLEDGHA